MRVLAPPVGLLHRIEAVGLEAAAPAAAEVDRDARFPTEALEALRAERLLSVLVPTHLGGEGISLGELSSLVATLSRHCSSAGMVYAMHQIQVACLVRHGSNGYLEDYVRQDVVGAQVLLASATTEVGVGGDVRSSVCAVERDGKRFRLEKLAPVISYGEQADAVLVTARRSPDSPPGDQVLALCRKPGLHLAPAGAWDTLGFRGTCSPGFRLSASEDLSAILPDTFSDISARTMLPVCHILWASVWLGIADAALARASAYTRGEARKTPGSLPPAALRLADLATVHRQLQATVQAAVRHYDDLPPGADELTTMAFALEMNSVKVSASTLVVDVVSRALLLCGMAGYRQDSAFSLGRLLRDAYGAALMVNNDRISANCAQMLLVHKES